MVTTRKDSAHTQVIASNVNDVLGSGVRNSVCYMWLAVCNCWAVHGAAAVDISYGKCASVALINYVCSTWTMVLVAGSVVYFICSLFNGVLSNSGRVGSNEGIIVNKEFGIDVA